MDRAETSFNERSSDAYLDSCVLAARRRERCRPCLRRRGDVDLRQFPCGQDAREVRLGAGCRVVEHARLGSIRLTLGCSASLVSSDGLVMTNHHCVRECVSDLADAQHDYIANGFYAAMGAEEKKCPAMEAN